MKPVPKIRSQMMRRACCAASTALLVLASVGSCDLGRRLAPVQQRTSVQGSEATPGPSPLRRTGAVPCASRGGPRGSDCNLAAGRAPAKPVSADFGAKSWQAVPSEAELNLLSEHTLNYARTWSTIDDTSAERVPAASDEP
jgi:hypothetical protein